MPDTDKKYTYIYDGSFEGFLCCVYTFYKDKDKLVAIKTDDEQIEFFIKTKAIVSDDNNFNTVYDAIENKLSFDFLNIVYNAFLSDTPNKELKILDFIVLGFKYGDKIINNISNHTVIDVLKLSQKVLAERHKLYGLVRFKQINNYLFSVIEPTHNIIPIIGNHFRKRYPNENWFIYDLNRETPVMHNNGNLQLLSMSKEKMKPYLEYKDDFETLWKTYHKAMSIESRKNERCQRNFMPKKYWKRLSEMD